MGKGVRESESAFLRGKRGVLFEGAGVCTLSRELDERESGVQGAARRE